MTQSQIHARIKEINDSLKLQNKTTGKVDMPESVTKELITLESMLQDLKIKAFFSK